MKIQKIRIMAKEHGINSFGKTKTNLIREIQLSEESFDCFGKATGYCDQKECCFRSLCLNDIKTLDRKKELPTLKTAMPKFYSTKYLLAGMFFED
jgi:hypothetical protein